MYIRRSVILIFALYRGDWKTEDLRIKYYQGFINVMEVDEKMHNEDLHNLYFSPNIIRMIKSRRMRWAGHEICIGRRGMQIGF
jgi:hypothetical protein